MRSFRSPCRRLGAGCRRFGKSTSALSGGRFALSGCSSGVAGGWGKLAGDPFKVSGGSLAIAGTGGDPNRCRQVIPAIPDERREKMPPWTEGRPAPACNRRICPCNSSEYTLARLELPATSLETAGARRQDARLRLRNSVACYMYTENASVTSGNDALYPSVGGRKVTSLSYTQTEIAGMGENFIKLVDKTVVILEKGGLKVDEVKKIVSKKLETATAANARQEEAKRNLGNLTKEVEAANDDLYRTVSGYLDGCIGIAGKGTVDGKNFQRLRSRIRIPGSQVGEDLEAEPLPVPVKEATQ